jgi:phosphatidylglycerol---prolipoprotein diacylglyceryl transferase
VHKIAFVIGPFVVKWFGILVASGFIAGLWTASRRAPRLQIHPDTIIDLGPWLLLGAIVGARAWFVVSYWDSDFAGRPLYGIFMVQNGGIVYYGGLIGASVACIIFARLKKLPLWRLADVLAPSIALGSFFGRWGCLMNGCCYGAPTTMPWGIQFPEGHESYPHYVHPTQIYDSLLNLSLYGFLAWLYRRRKFDGQIFGVYLICYALLRSFVELFRGDYVIEPPSLPGQKLGLFRLVHDSIFASTQDGLSPGQKVSIGIIIAGLLLLWNQWRKGPSAGEGARPAMPHKA